MGNSRGRRMTDLDVFLDAPEGATPGGAGGVFGRGVRGGCGAAGAGGGVAGGGLRGAASWIRTAGAERGARVAEGEAEGTMIGNYKLLQEIGEGGFGVVYMAEQQRPVKRRVALKMIKPGMDTKQVVARFEAERQALAMMDHPNIAKVLRRGGDGERAAVLRDGAGAAGCRSPSSATSTS